MTGFKQIKRFGKLDKSRPLVFVGKVDPRFLQRVARTAQRHILEPPKLEKSRVMAVRRRKQNVGVKKQPVHLFTPQMSN